MHNFYFFTFALSSPYTLAPPKVLSLDKRKIALSSCFDSRTFEIKSPGSIIKPIKILIFFVLSSLIRNFAPKQQKGEDENRRTTAPKR